MSVRIAVSDPDDLFISRITNAIVVCDMVMSTLTLPLQFIILCVLIKDKEYSGSFFTIYKVGLIYDIAGFVCVNVIGVIPTRGILLSEEFAASQFYLKLYFFVTHSTHACQTCTNPILCLNRATAVLLPMYHKRIWEHPYVLPLCFLGQFFGGLIVGLQTVPLEHFQMRYSTGERFPLLCDSPGTRAFWLETFAELFTFSILMWILYGIMIWKFRSKISKYGTKSEKADSRRAFSLLIIAVNVLLLETIYCLFYGYWFVTNVNYQVDFRGFMAAFYTIIDVYSCSPSFLLLFFCSSVRERVIAIFRFIRFPKRRTSVAERKITVKSRC